MNDYRPGSVSKYVIEVCPPGQTIGCPTVDCQPAATCPLSGLQAGTVYGIRAYSVTSVGDSPWTNVTAMATCPASCANTCVNGTGCFCTDGVWQEGRVWLVFGSGARARGRRLSCRGSRLYKPSHTLLASLRLPPTGDSTVSGLKYNTGLTVKQSSVLAAYVASYGVDGLTTTSVHTSDSNGETKPWW